MRRWPDPVRGAALALTLGLVGAVAVATTPGAPAPGAPSAATIKLEHFMFGPTTITVPAGVPVHWRNLDGEVHTVVSLDGLFRSPALDQGDEFSYTFKAPGHYRYVCTLHPQMMGEIVVTAPP
ncbi:MAG: cupredoxin domain-containing protein [Proteobacteria bacterium]|nr:cupredoxin domain-containing protein [Pseudomonadota bacterium]